MALACLLLAGGLEAQELRPITTATRLHKEPRGIALVSLPAGTAVEPKRVVGDWREIVVEGWIFTRSVEPTRRDGFDLVVTAENGENIRRSPNGEIVGRVRTGTLLFAEEVQGGWTRVRRTGWVPRDAVGPAAGARVAPAAAAARPRRDSVAPSEIVTSQGTAASLLAAQAAADRAEVARETQVFAAPSGGQYGSLQAGAPARVLSRSGEWTRVQFEGWVRDIDLKESSDAALSGITAAEVRTDPSKFVGRTVDWRVELIAVQEADELRPEMPLGQNYLLTRGPLPEPGFVYVTVTEAQAAQFRALQALQELTLRVVIRAPRTRFLTTPVVELVARVG